jgi:hypothetical protein
MDLMPFALREEPWGPEADTPRAAGTHSPAVGGPSVAAWLDAHRHQIIECGRHNGLARLTIKACAERYRRAVVRWVDSLDLRENEKHCLRLSFAVCGACPVGAYGALLHGLVRAAR